MDVATTDGMTTNTFWIVDDDRGNPVNYRTIRTGAEARREAIRFLDRNAWCESVTIYEDVPNAIAHTITREDI